MNQHDAYRAVFDQLMAEFAQATGVKVLGASGGILISAPRLGVFYHCDSTDTMLWHVRGEKTIYVYPEEEAFLPEQAYEGVILKENLSDIPYNPALEASATPIHLRPGESVSWPLHGPHRVVNHDSFNVSVTIEFKTPRSTFTNGTYYTNGVLRRRFGLKPKTRAIPEMLMPAYWATVAASTSVSRRPIASPGAMAGAWTGAPKPKSELQPPSGRRRSRRAGPGRRGLRRERRGTGARGGGWPRRPSGRCARPCP